MVPRDQACIVWTTSVWGIPDEIGEDQQDVALDVGPQIPVAAASVMANVEGFRKGVLLALHHRREVLTGTVAEFLGFGDAAIFPKRTAERSVVQLIQDALLEPLGVSWVLDDRGLPRLNRISPLLRFEQGFFGDLERLPGLRRIIISVAAPPTRAVSKFNLREIPGECEGNSHFRARSNLDLHAQRCRGEFAVQASGLIGQSAV